MFLAAIILSLGLVAPASGQPAAGSVVVPEGLPAHFGIGLSAHPDENGLYGWMPDSGIPWDYAYQYLAAGVNTGNGWQQWNSRAEFPLMYARGADERGYRPVLTYYMLLQSNGPCAGCEEARADLANLNDAGVMAAYYRDFATLMKRLGPGNHDGVQGFGKLAIVHVEPDLSGYAQQAVLDNRRCFGFCTGQGNDPSLLRAAVSGTGVTEVAGLPDTYQGYNWALLKLRDLYAPNVLLAFHVSGWSALRDVGSSTDQNLDAAALGRTVGEFAAASGLVAVPEGSSSYDLLFNDVADRDAAYYGLRLNRRTWWDRLNVSVPNFRRWEAFLGSAIQAAGGKGAFVWQIPLGNQVFATMNNTDGHYQDNRAEYFFEHVEELREIGVIGLLFGRGNDGSTTNADVKRDGVTNPAPFCTQDGLSEGETCNTRQSVYPDDDGGYLRLAAERYFQEPVALTGTTLVPAVRPLPGVETTLPVGTGSRAETSAEAPMGFQTSATAPASAAPGAAVQVTGAVTSAAAGTVLVDLEIYDRAGNKVHQQFWDNQSFDAGETKELTTDWRVPAGAQGPFTVKISVFAPGWGTLHHWDNGAAIIQAG